MNHGPSESSSRDKIALGVILLVAAALRLFHVTFQSFWLDEGFTAKLIVQPLGDFVRLLRVEPFMAAYDILLYPWARLGTSEAMIRMPSVIFGVATVALVYRLGLRLFDRRVAIVGATILALSPSSIAYSQEARSYSMLMFLSALSWLSFLDAVQRDTPRNWLRYAVVAALAGYTHFFGVLIVPSQIAALVAARHMTRQIARRLTLTCLAIAAAWLPIVLFFMSPNTVNRADWMPPTTLEEIGHTIVRISGGLNGNAGVILAVLWTIACALAVVAMFGLSEPQSSAGASLGYFAALSGAISPVVLTLAISEVRPMLQARYLLECVPSAAVLAAAGIVQIRWRPALYGLAVAFIVLVLRQQYTWFWTPQKDDWRSATRYLAANARPGDAVAFFPPYAKFSFDYYTEQLGLKPPEQVSYPTTNPIGDPAFLHTKYVSAQDAAAHLVPNLSASRAWVISRCWNGIPAVNRDAEAVLGAFGRKYPSMRKIDVSGVDMRLYSSEPQ